MYMIPNRYIHYNMEGATLWLKNLANFCCSPPMSFSLGGKKVPYFTSYNFKEQALRNF